MKQKITTYLLIFLLALIPRLVEAHAPNQSYVYLQVYKDAIHGRYEMNIKEANAVLGLDLSEDITQAELQAYKNQLVQYYTPRVRFSTDGTKYDVEFGGLQVLTAGRQGTFIQLDFVLTNVSEVPDKLEVFYDVVFEKKTDHQGLLLIEYNWKAGVRENESIPSLFFDKNDKTQELDLTDGSIMQGFIALIIEGIWHIWIGIDHILFLLALVLPAVITRGSSDSTIYPSLLKPGTWRNITWSPVMKFRPALIYIVKIVTFFTISHTITLSLAALQIIILPSRFVESIIAISIALAAYHNIRPIFKGKEWTIAFGFGLFHGFGFASVLADIGLSGEYLGWSLLGFNIGVEIGQLAIILAIFPVLYFLRKAKIYNYLLVFGSVILIFISLYWFVERAFDYDLQLGNFLFGIYDSIFN